MALATLSALPDRFNAGTTVKYSRTFADYPASDGWTLALHISGGAYFSIAATVSGTTFAVTIPASKTATVSVTNGATTAAAKIVTRASGDFVVDGVLAGYLVSGPGIASGAYVKTVDSATQVTLSEAAEATGSSLALKFRFPDGIYAWEERASKAGEVAPADKGTVNIDPDISSAPAGALQSWEERMLPLVDDILQGRITSDMESYQIADRAKTAVRMRDWLDFRSYLKRVIAQRRTPGKLLVMRATFTGAGAES
jgi:hypothetical protein